MARIQSTAVTPSRRYPVNTVWPQILFIMRYPSLIAPNIIKGSGLDGRITRGGGWTLGAYAV